jgi:transmembrane sensor
MKELSRDNYELEDFVSDESFINYHFKSNLIDQLSWEEWLSKNPAKQSLVEEAREIINGLSLNISEKEYDQELKKLTAATNKTKSHIPVSQVTGGNKFFQFHIRKKRSLQFLVLFLLIIIAVGYGLFQQASNNSEKLTETFNNSTLPLILTLSDSTVVTLDPGSYLQYPLIFKGKERHVYLHGNAQFRVKRNIDHPFKVHEENTLTTVLGTVFNMKSSGDSAVVVELLKGKLNVEIINSKQETEQSVLLEPNEKAVYVRNNRHLYKTFMGSFHNLSFNKSNFDELALQIKNAFGTTLINESPKKEWRFTGEFNTSTAKDIVENICLVKKLSFTVKGDTIIIK